MCLHSWVKLGAGGVGQYLSYSVKGLPGLQPELCGSQPGRALAQQGLSGHGLCLWALNLEPHPWAHLDTHRGRAHYGTGSLWTHKLLPQTWRYTQPRGHSHLGPRAWGLGLRSPLSVPWLPSSLPDHHCHHPPKALCLPMPGLLYLKLLSQDTYLFPYVASYPEVQPSPEEYLVSPCTHSMV